MCQLGKSSEIEEKRFQKPQRMSSTEKKWSQFVIKKIWSQYIQKLFLREFPLPWEIIFFLFSILKFFNVLIFCE